MNNQVTRYPISKVMFSLQLDLFRAMRFSQIRPCDIYMNSRSMLRGVNPRDDSDRRG